MKLFFVKYKGRNMIPFGKLDRKFLEDKENVKLKRPKLTFFTRTI